MLVLSHRKVPSDRPEEEEHEDRKKKSKLSETSHPLMDEPMMPSEEESFKENSATDMDQDDLQKDKGSNKFPSYKASLMGFNGVAHGEACAEEDDLFRAETELSWKMLLESEEYLKLKEVFRKMNSMNGTLPGTTPLSLPSWGDGSVFIHSRSCFKTSGIFNLLILLTCQIIILW